MNFSGPRFTWSNGHNGLACLWAKLDSFLANATWFSTLQNFSYKHLARTNSNHYPFFLTIRDSQHSKAKVFHFDNYWLDYEGCHNSVLKAWNINSSSSHLQAILHSITCTKNNLLKLRYAGLSSIDSELQNIESEITSIEETMSTSSNMEQWNHT